MILKNYEFFSKGIECLDLCIKRHPNYGEAYIYKG